MLTLRLLGFFQLFRKHNLCRGEGLNMPQRGAGAGYHGRVEKLGLAGFFVVIALVVTVFGTATQGLAASGEEEEKGRPYFGRDAEGNRVFGTDHKSEAGFSRDPETGDRIFKTAPPRQQEDQSGYSGPIWVSPEVTPGRPPSYGQRPTPRTRN
ncbi:hypothetical protein LJC48_05440 [Desulfovibrio sp. OttesenSCG-928-C06]|nr:hypothetical protein [Desulfovibrio sp. OttesenSCG-928-C06]